MTGVKVKVADLLTKVKENREKHRAIFEKALVGYRRAAISELEEQLADARAGKKVARFTRLVEPMDQTNDYDRLIAMLEMSTDSIIELTERQFSCYVMDEWEWKNQFTSTTAGYVS